MILIHIKYHNAWLILSIITYTHIYVYTIPHNNLSIRIIKDASQLSNCLNSLYQNYEYRRIIEIGIKWFINIYLNILI